MASFIKGVFSADGSSDVFVASKFTVFAGSDNGSDFGGGSLSIEVSHDGVDFTTAYTFMEEGAQTSDEYTGGAVVKATLTGSTSPNLTYSIKYEK